MTTKLLLSCMLIIVTVGTAWAGDMSPTPTPPPPPSSLVVNSAKPQRAILRVGRLKVLEVIELALSLRVVKLF